MLLGNLRTLKGSIKIFGGGSGWIPDGWREGSFIIYWAEDHTMKSIAYV
jgi:hypothetical protein